MDRDPLQHAGYKGKDRPENLKDNAQNSAFQMSASIWISVFDTFRSVWVIGKTPGFGGPNRVQINLLFSFSHDPVPARTSLLCYCFRKNNINLKYRKSRIPVGPVYPVSADTVNQYLCCHLPAEKNIRDPERFHKQYDSWAEDTHFNNFPGLQLMADKSIPEKDQGISTTLQSDLRWKHASQIPGWESPADGNIRKNKNEAQSFINGYHRILASAAENFSLQIESRQGEITTDFKAVSSLAMIDEIHFTNAISNLIDNAIKYSKENRQ